MKSVRLIPYAVATIFLVAPSLAFAFPFGGAATIVIPCYNGAIYALVGPPVGGPFLWTPATETFQFGPPTHGGQWLLGNAGPPYFCLVSILPIVTYPGIDIIMMGSSQ